MYDINLLPIKIYQGQQTVVTNDFKASAPPRRAARSRSEDLLILSLFINGEDWISSEIHQSWLDNLMHSFFRTSGSVTSAMRTLIETLNLTLMEKNLKSGRDGGPTAAAVNMAAIHRRVLYIVQSGLTHAFVLNQQGLHHFYDASRTDRGLGFSRSPNIRYYQADIGQGSYYFTTSAPPTTWTEDALFAGGFPSLEQLRRRLSNQAPQGLRIDLAQILPGEGQIIIQQPQKQAEVIEEKQDLESELEPPKEQPLPTSEVEALDTFDTREIRPESPKPDKVETESPENESPDPEVDEVQSELYPAQETAAGTQALPEIKEVVKEEIERPKAVKKPEPAPPTEESTKEEKREKLIADPEEIKERSLKGLAAMLSKWRSFREKISSFFQNVISRWTPLGADGIPKLSKGTLLTIAIVVPLILVGIAAGVYFARGRTLQYQRFIEQAQLAATTAMAAENPNQSREAWYRTMDYLEQAETYKQTEEVTQLRQQAQDAIDALDGAVRLAYQPAIIGSLYSEIEITNIISYGPDLYMLDSAGGRVIHAERMSQGYEVDPDFVCAAGNYSGGRVESVVDMAALPINNPYQAHILAVDAIGNVVYCAPGLNPVVQSLPTIGGIGGEITNITYDSNYLYALIPTSSAILVYRPSNGQFLDVPTNFFEDMNFEDIPNLNLVEDIAVNGPDLYLLQGDGKLIDCTTSSVGGNPVTCENPVTYIDGRPGKEDQIFTIPGSSYAAIQYTTPPDPSLSILDATSGDIYRFSLRFRLYERLRPDMGDFEVESQVATAFTIGIDRVAFLAFGHQVFYAYVE
jgi:hypothetical protein